MNKMDYFKSEKDFYEFALLFTDSAVRKNLLGINYSCYSSEDAATRWYENIKEKISDERAIERLDRLYADMTM